jgi:hypothetical protein
LVGGPVVWLVDSLSARSIVFFLAVSPVGKSFSCLIGRPVVWLVDLLLVRSAVSSVV